MKKIFFALLMTMAASPARAFDGAALTQNLRETLALDTRTTIEVQGEPTPSKLADLDKVTVLVGGAPYEVFLTKDRATYFWGFTSNLNESPDQKRVTAIDPKTGHSVGASTAPVTIVEYSDFACQFCRRAHTILSTELYKTYTTGQVRWVFKHYPLTTHPWALGAAAASECVERQKPGMFWTMADFYFSNQDEITEENLAVKTKNQVKAMGLKAAPFDACMADKKLREKILAQKKEGAAVGVSSTPTIFVNGRMRRGFRDFEDIKVVIDEKLKAAGK